MSRLHAAIELLRDTAEDQLRGELIDAVLAAAMTWRTGGYGGGSIWARQPLPPIVAELAASLTPDLCDREGCCQTAAPGAWRLLGAELHSGVRLEVRLCPACAVELARRGASARASAGELTPAPASVERGSTSPPPVHDSQPRCAVPYTLGPCLPRLRDGRCIWCERQLRELETVGPNTLRTHRANCTIRCGDTKRHGAASQVRLPQGYGS